ncbi:FAD dependent oxidoreductase (plasmid) [Gemmatirosa kalamazoonensis]|uniref:FAD dependent oxidoreductase n=1 Tax=Gemmatirosa kalamazoonensis TaxID=861299 RepID=W0RU30_9BACT|nr:FAD-dependent oxidoreductase [Gemmatirosa kalamazoonensis]AHG93815.1 FAD dependent oxidoreductase [Gemmatirosa kalamazoonensis]
MEPNAARPVEGARPSIWQATADVPSYPKLKEDLTVDVCVVGAGIAGLTTAYHLVREGKSVVVLDDGPVGGGETGRTTAHIATAVDDYYHEIARVHGDETARRVAESFRAALDRIEGIVRDEAIDCEFTRLDGWWFAGDAQGRDVLATEHDAARAAGEAVELVDDWPLANVFPDAPFPRLALRFPNQGQFHALKYLAGLARAIVERGGRIHCGEHVNGVEDAKDGARCAVKTESGRTVHASDVVVATNTPVNDWVKMHTKQAPYRTYVVGMRVSRGWVPPGLYWDTLDPYHYVRLANPLGTGDEDVLIVGGEDHKTGQSEAPEEEAFGRLESWARARFPVGETLYRWSGQVMEPVDYLGFIGRNPGSRRLWIATGDSGNGMSHGTIAGMLLADLIVGRESPWAPVYDPSRVTLKAMPVAEFLKENLNVAAQYVDYVTPGEVRDVAEIPAGEGRLVRRGTKKLAVYKRDDGSLDVRSAVCTHLYCIVAWNSAEKTWDCPCHGSRFAHDGTVINGPAASPLEEAELGE